MDMAGIMITTGVGLVFILLGYLIWFKKMLFLISGYNESTFKGDKEKLGRTTGIVLIAVGMITILFPFCLYWFGNSAGIVYCLLIVIGTAAVYWVMLKR